MNTDTPDTEATPEHRVPFTRFFIVMALEIIAIIGLYAWLFPNAFAFDTGKPWLVLMWTAIIGVPLSLFEYLYHRYMLHSAVLPFMAMMHRDHTLHHSLTSVKAPVTPHEPARLVEVKSEFPVEEEHQEEAMMFPLWSPPVFVAIFLPLIALPIKLIFPSQPIYLALITSVFAFYMSYEVWHAILHLPFERFWKPFLENRATKRIAKNMYSFHLMHHWRPTANLAIVGFWGIALWDHAFRTHRRPENLPLDGAEVNYNDAKLAKPLWPIRLLDRWQSSFYKGSRSLERFLARVFLKRTG